MHQVEAKGILSAQNGMNIYRGCTHGCIYCDARSTCYQMKHPFEDIEVKKNAPELLEKALRSKRKKCMIGTGAMSDPYLHYEEELKLTRRCLELIDAYGFAEVLNILRDEGIPTIVWMTPILPFINDTKENITGLLNICREAKVYGVLSFGIGLTLRDGDRQYYYKQLDKHFSGMKERYIHAYGNAYELPSPNHTYLWKLLKSECKAAGIVCDAEQLFAYMREYEDKTAGEQLSLF